MLQDGNDNKESIAVKRQCDLQCVIGRKNTAVEKLNTNFVRMLWLHIVLVVQHRSVSVTPMHTVQKILNIKANTNALSYNDTNLCPLWGKLHHVNNIKYDFLLEQYCAEDLSDLVSLVSFQRPRLSCTFCKVVLSNSSPGFQNVFQTYSLVTGCILVLVHIVINMYKD